MTDDDDQSDNIFDRVAINDAQAEQTQRSLPRIAPRGPGRQPLPARQNAKRTIADSIKQAALTGDLPHEWLLGIMRGNKVIQRSFVRKQLPDGAVVEELVESVVHPTLETRIDIAKELLPYFAPKLSAQALRIDTKTDSDSASGEDKLTTLAERLVQLQQSTKEKDR